VGEKIAKNPNVDDLIIIKNSMTGVIRELDI